ncbi:hypothetical protein [Bacillus toyonensis]|uniref:hypothetical protein n=1 Tax=Bacillus toyonensis TaxID=155322 RepID=UPI002E203452|nr:hypothetical protein [Bacillus toyonensis]
MKEKILVLLNEYFETEFHYTTNTICNSENRPVFHYSPEDNKVGFVGRWPRKREKWKYIYGMYIALRDEPVQMNLEPLKYFTGHKNDDMDENILKKVADEYDQYLTFLDENYVYNLIDHGNRAHIISEDLTFQVHLRNTERNWLLRITNVTKVVKKHQKIPHGDLIKEVAKAMEHHINAHILTSTFDTSPDFLVKYPQLTAYCEKRLSIPVGEAESLVKEVEMHTGLSAAELEYELSAGRKRLRLQSICFQRYKMGGKGVHYYEYPSRWEPGAIDRIYFKRTDKNVISYNENNLRQDSNEMNTLENR